MCGLVGMMGDFSQKHKDMFLNMLYFDTLRGQDSTGVATIRMNGDMEIYKRTIPGYEFVQEQRAKDLMRIADRVWLGHNRFKTVGMNVRLNAHPFDVVDDEGAYTLVGAHNGTLNNKHEIERALEGNPVFGTDSEALLNLIAEKGPKDALAMTEGAWALTWYDGVEEELCLIRNDKRDLWFGFSEDRRQLFWASEPWMIRISSQRHDIKVGPLFNARPDTLYRFENDKGKAIQDPIEEGDLVGRPDKKPFSSNNNWTGYSQTSHQKTTKETPAKTSTIVSGTFGTTNNSGNQHLIALREDEVRGYQSKPIKKQTLAILRQAGCNWCDDVLAPNVPVSFLSENAICCPKCIRGTHFDDVGEKRTVVMLSAKQQELLEKTRDEKIKANGGRT